MKRETMMAPRRPIKGTRATYRTQPGDTGPALPDGVDADGLWSSWVDYGTTAQADQQAQAEASELSRRLDRVQREAMEKECYDLHVAGWTYRQLGERFNVSATTAGKMVQAYARTAVPLTERVDAFRVSIERYSGVLRMLLADFAAVESVDTRLQVADRLLRYMTRLDDLQGLGSDREPAVALETLNAVDQAAEELVDRELAWLADQGLLA